MKPALCAVAVAASMLAGVMGTKAQTITIQPSSDHSDRPARPALTRIQTQTQFSLRGTVANSIDEQRAVQETIRRAIYEMATKECGILTDVFHAECRLVSLNVNSNVLDRGNGNEGATGSGNATFELTAKPN